MNPLAQIAQQVADDSIEIVRDTASSAVKASADIAKGTIEQVSVAPSQVKADEGDKEAEADKRKREEVSQQKEAERKQRLEAVRSELSAYTERKRRLDVRIAQEKAQEQQQKKQAEGVEKQKRENWLSQLMKRTAGGAHGESDRQKE